MNPGDHPISCDVCLDLIPLVKDQVASEDSKALVYAHLQGCEECRRVFEATPTIQQGAINDKKVMKTIKRNFLVLMLGMLSLGGLLGVYLSNSMGMFYNLLIMPLVGGISYLILQRRWFYVPLGIFVSTYFWIIIQMIGEGAWAGEFQWDLLLAPLFFCIIYVLLCFLGVVIATLLKYAFRKEGSDETI